jgi:hypothetical protein
MADVNLDDLDAGWEDDDDDVDDVDAGWGEAGGTRESPERPRRTAAEKAAARKAKLLARKERQRKRVEETARKQKQKQPKARLSAKPEKPRASNETSSAVAIRAMPKAQAKWRPLMVAVPILMVVAIVAYFLSRR